jgi:hypothetical protein
VSSFASGALLSGLGWNMVQIAVMPFAVVAAATVFWLRQRSAATAAQYAGL